MTARHQGWVALAIGSLAMFLLPAAVTGSTLAFPDIEETFLVSRSTLSWVLSGYSIATAAFTLLGGQLADRLGSRMLFLAGVAVFAAGGLAAALAPNPGLLIAGRALQGVGAALYAPASLAMVLPAFPRARHPFIIGIWAAAVPVGSSLAPTLSALVLWLADWRWLFGVQFVAAALLLVPAIRQRADSVRIGRGERPDYLGVVVGTSAVGLLALGIVQAPRWGWTSPATLLAFGSAALLTPWFLHHTRRQTLPLLDLSLFSVPTFRHANLVSLGVSMVGSSVWVLWPIHLRTVWGYSEFDVGLAITPTPLVAGIFSVFTGRWAEQFGYRGTLILGCVVLTVANLWFVVFYGEEPDYVAAMLPGLVLYGIAMGLAFAPLNGAALVDVPEHAFGRANAAFLTGRALAGAIGVAALIAILGDASGVDALPEFDRAFLFLTGIAAVSSLAVIVGWPRRTRITA